MAGCTVGTGDNRGFFSPVYVERLSGAREIAEHEAQIDLYDQSETPPEIKAKLSSISVIEF